MLAPFSEAESETPEQIAFLWPAYPADAPVATGDLAALGGPEVPRPEEVLPWDVIDNGVAKGYFWKELERSRQEKLSGHCPEIQGCIRCGVCVETPNPFYRLPDK